VRNVGGEKRNFKDNKKPAKLAALRVTRKNRIVSNKEDAPPAGIKKGLESRIIQTLIFFTF
jgi:hypothetical protein